MKQYIAKLCFALLALFITLPALADDILYSATVMDANDEPLMGATVKVPDTPNITVTDLDGNFTIKVPKGGIVEISYIGFHTEIIKDFNIKTIILKEDSQALDEVVVVGYGTQKKAHLTGSISTVNMSDITDLSTGSLASSLSGLVNGLSVSGGEARPGESPRMYIRGAEDMSAVGSSAQEPLFVIDGFVSTSSAFNNLDSNDIESISVLKDSSAAVYGARAANGVILVTTKRGKIGEPVISYSGSVGIADEIARPKMLDAYNYGRLYNIMAAADPTNTGLDLRTDLFQSDELDAMRNLNYDLLDANWKTAWTQKHNVGVSGATEKANYYASISYFKQDGNLGKLDYDRWNYRAGVDVTLKKWIKASLQVSGDYGKKNSPLIKVGGSRTDDYNMLLTHPRYIPEYVNGLPITPYGPTNSRQDQQQDYNFSVLQDLGDYSNNMTNNLQINSSLSVDFGFIPALKGLNARFTYGKNISNSKSNEKGSNYNLYYMSERFGSGSHLYTPIPNTDQEEIDRIMSEANFLLANNGQPIANGSTNGYLRRQMSRTDNYQMNLQINYNRQFGDHSLGALFAIEKSESEYEYLIGRVTDVYEFGTDQSNAVGPNNDPSTEFKRKESGTLSYIGRVNYAFADKYLLEFLLRVDSSTKFAPENYWGTFPSVSLGWVISQENWFRNNVTWIDYLKIRASYGLTGRDNTVAWQWMQNYGTDADKGPIFGIGNNNPAGSHIALNKNNAAVNRDAHWDKSYKSNLGIDFNVLHNRLAFNIDGYYNRERDMLMPYRASIPGTVGTQSANVNYGQMNSWGVELAATWRDKIGKDFSYKVNINTGYSDNEVILMDWNTKTEAYHQIYKGHRTDMGTWGMQCLGMFRSFQDIEEYFAKNNITSYMGMTKDKVRPGMLIYKDIRSKQNADGSYGGPDGIISESDDKVCLSNRANPYHVTMNLTATYKAFSLTAQMNVNWGGYSFIPSNSLKPGKSIEYTNMPSFWNPDDMYVYNDIYDNSGNLIMAQNRDAYLPNLAYSNVNSVTSSFWRVSGTRATLSRLTLAYSLPASILKHLGVSSCRFNVTGQNLLSLYNPYPDNFIDPMMSYGNYPILRKITLGLNLSF